MVGVEDGREVEWEDLEGRSLGTKHHWSPALNDSWACRKHLHPQRANEMIVHKLESHIAATANVPQGYPPKKKKKGELSVALYDVHKASPESPCNGCCAVPGRVLWQEGEHFLLYFLITL